MKNEYTQETKSLISTLSKQGYSSRFIADELGISKSGVNQYLSKIRYSAPPENKPKILFFDIESSAALVLCFSRHKQYISQQAVIEEGGKILMAGYSWDGSDDVKVIGNIQDVVNLSDYAVCKYFHDLFQQADAVCAHNLRQFDMKVLETRCLINGLPPLKKVKMIDTLDIAKKHFRFPSNSLDSLGAYHGVGRKVSHEGMGLWRKVQSGDKQAFNEMVEYCKGDVQLLKDVFYALRSRGLVSSFNAGLYYQDDGLHCRTCGSTDLELTGNLQYTSVNTYEEYVCNSCGSIHRSRVSSTTAEKRKSLLM